MIRSILIAAGFLSVTIVLIAFGPGSRDEDRFDEQVTRADTSLGGLQQVDAAAQTPAQSAMQAAVQASMQAPGATPAQPAATPGAAQAPDADTAAALAAITGKKAPPPSRGNVDMFLKDMSTGVLAELGIDAGTEQANKRAKMRDMTASILADIQGGGATSADSSNLQGLVAKALRQGQSDNYIDILVNEAARKGEVAVPAALVTSEGRVDTSTLLASIVSQAKSASSSGDTRPVERAPVQRQTYVVQRGESLGGIAQRIYGDAAFFTTIFDANRDRLASPDRIRPGQTLIIPAG